jgi:hypothetical protein
VDPQAPLEEFERVAAQHAVFRVLADSPRSTTGAPPASS